MALAAPMGQEGDRESFHRARLDLGEVALSDDRDSSTQRALAASDLLIRRRPNAPSVEIGDRVEVLDL
jgi:molybdopterin molybdotransferase